MLAYQSGIAKFNGMDVQVLAISTDFSATLKHWKENELKAEFPMLSDHMRKVSEQYGILITQVGLANRATFVVDVDGKIASIEEGNTALDPMGAETACSRLKHKTSE
jgi:alkyl hydroperoxide reductase subunit AhpC